MSNDLIRLTMAIVVLAHGVGHVLFAPLAFSLLKVPATGRSWLLTGLLGDGAAQLLATGIAIVAVGLFAAGAYGVFAQVGSWRPVLIAGALLSIGLIGRSGMASRRRARSSAWPSTW